MEEITLMRQQKGNIFSAGSYEFSCLLLSFIAHSELFQLYNGYIICTGMLLGEKAMKDSELIRKLHNGDKEAAGLMIERYYADIYRFCLYMVQSEEDAYDMAQETFLKFIKYGTFYHHQNLKGYLLTIARNLCFNYFRDKKETAVEWEILDEILKQENQMTETEDVIYLQNLLKKLSQDIREVIVLRMYEEMKFKDIAGMMGCSVSTAKSRFRLGISQLKRMMEGEHDDGR